MEKLSIYNIAQAILKRNSVQFDQNIAWNEEDAWPYWYPLIPSPFEETDVLNNGLGIIGFELEPGEIKDISIKTDRDAPFRFINTKYVINMCTIDCPVAGADTITVTAGNVELVAAGAAFLATDVGRKVCWDNDNGIRETGIIAVFTDTTHVDLGVAPIGAAAALTAFEFSSPGVIMVNAGSTDVGGDTQSTFLTTYAAGQRISYLDDAGLERCGMVLSIADDQNMTLADPAEVDGARTAGASTITTIALNVEIIAAAPSWVAGDVGKLISWTNDAGVLVTGEIAAFTDTTHVDLLAAAGSIATAIAFDFQEAAHSPTKWEWWTAIGGTAPQPQIPITFEDIITPITRFIKVKLNIPSLKNIDFYGDNQYQSATGLTAHRTPIDTLQGEKNGNPMLKSPDALVPSEGTISYQFENTHTQPIFINAVAFGYKISLENDVGE